MHKLLAQSLDLPWGNGSVTIQGKLNTPGGGGYSDIGSIVSYALTFVFSFAGIGLLLMLVFGGFALLTSAGDAKKLEQGKQRITYAIVGFLIIFAAFWMVQAAGIIFNFSPAQDIFR